MDASKASRRRGCIETALVCVNPSVKPSVCQLPVRGAFWHSATTIPKLSPFTGDSSRARPVGDAARGESGGIGSVASGSKARRPYSNQRSWHEVPKWEWLKEAKCREVFPLSLFTIVHRQLPRKRWSLLGAILYAKIYELTPRLEQGRLTHCRS